MSPSSPPATEPTLIERLRGSLARQLVRLPDGVQILLSGQPPIEVDGQTLDPSIQLLLALRPARQGLMDSGATESRARLRREVLSIRGRLTPVGAVRDLTIEGAAGPLAARHYAPERPEGKPLLVFYHGGGFVIGDLDTHDETCRLLCRHAGHHVLSVDYRLAPEHPFPAPLDDAVAAFRWGAAHAGGLGADPARVGVGGDSAGGTLAAVVSLLTRHEAVRPAAQLLIYPATDRNTPRPSHQLFDRVFFLTTEDRDAFYRHYLGDSGVDSDDPRISPLRAPDLSVLPPALLVTAGFDILRDEGEAYAAALEAAGTPVLVHREPGHGHGFVNMTGVSATARRGLVRIATEWAGILAPATSAATSPG
jgi:acetyl esterase